MRNQLIGEEEIFYQKANEFVDRNHQELELGEAYAKFYFWKSVWGSVPGQLALALSVIGLYNITRTYAFSLFLSVLISIGGGPLAALILLGVIAIVIIVILNRMPVLGWVTLISLAIYGLYCAW
jgi:hypothetical protein